jgi:hypothetical protein
VTNGRRRCIEAIRRWTATPRREMPKPSDAWGAWVEYRLGQIETMSGYADDVIGQQITLDARTAFLQKPFSARGLLSEVRRLLDAPLAG